MEITSIVDALNTAFLPAPSNQIAEANAGSGTFSDMVSHGIADVNSQLLTSQVDLQALATGDVQNLHQIMMRLEESRVSFQLLVQVRNRLLESYQEVMKMQI